MIPKSTAAKIALIAIIALSFWLGMQWQAFRYDDICLDMGGGRNPGNHPICVVTE